MPEYSEEVKEIIRCKKLCFRINGLEPGSGQISVLQKELFNGGLPKGAALMPLQQMDRANCITIGEKVFINHSFVTVAIGGIRIDDDEVMIAPCVKILTANHDFMDRNTLHVKSVHIKRNVWIGAGATLCPGITADENSVVAAGTVVTKDVPDNVVV